MVDNQNQNKKFRIAEKKVNSQDKLKIFQNGKTYQIIINAITAFQRSVQEKPNVYLQKEEIEKATAENKAFTVLLNIFKRCEDLLVEHPAIDKDKQRFGNTAFRGWYEAFEKIYDAEISNDINALYDGLSKDKQIFDTEEAKLADEIKPYFMECFGNSKRIDYGTGHELDFLCVLIILVEIGIFDSQEETLRKLVQIVFLKYSRVCRQIQILYNLEPAGSKGIYGLDDYSFLTFLFGAAEMINNKDKITPQELERDVKKLEEHAQKYMFFEAAHYNLFSKKGHIAEHSPILFQISQVPLWEKISKGLIKMYEDFVLLKLVVIQHFYFGSVLALE